MFALHRLAGLFRRGLTAARGDTPEAVKYHEEANLRREEKLREAADAERAVGEGERFGLR